jgi:hypothetical protein
MECVAALRGGVYSPPAEITPTPALPPGIPSTFHVTAGFWLLTTVAVNGCVWIVEIEAADGATVTPIWGGGLGGGGLGGGGLAAISTLSPPPQLTKVLTASRTRGRNIPVSGLREPDISGCHPAVSIGADLILEIVIMLDGIHRIAAVIFDAGAHS